MKWPRNSSKDEKADQLAIWLLRTFRCLWQQFTQNILIFPSCGHLPQITNLWTKD